jgi:phosphatidylserine decarboxylase
LAPQDYHHFHSPIDGCIHSMNILGIDLNSVNPIAMQSKHINILNDNMRIILNIKNKFGLECYYVIIGASLVGSVRFHSYKLNRIYQYLIDNKTNSHIITQPISVTIGEDLGTFLYGGSTVVMIFNKVIDFRTEIKQYSLYDNSNKSIDPIESYCHVRSYLGSFDENISNK